MKFHQHWHQQNNKVERNQNTRDEGGTDAVTLLVIFPGAALFLVIGSVLLFQYIDKHWYWINEFLIHLFK